MNAIEISGGNPLYGEVKIQGSKNAALPLLAATVLIKGVTVIHNCPRISDIFSMICLLEAIGCKVTFTENRLVVDSSNIDKTCFVESCAGTMRSTIALLGAMLGRMGEVSIPYPGGCVIGDRPIDMHINALKELGATFSNSDTHISAKCKRIIAGRVRLPFASVGASQNIILATVLSEGETIIEGCSKEPEVTELCTFLNRAGGNISGIGTDVLVINGVKSLHEINYRVVSDRIVAGTYLFAAAATRGDIVLHGAPIWQMDETLRVLKVIGGDYSVEQTSLHIFGKKANRLVPFIETAVYPGFPTDLQSQLMAVLALADGKSVIQEKIFENRFHIVEDLNDMGAKILIEDNKATIIGVKKLKGKHVTAKELRGGAALLIAGLAACGNTTVHDLGFLERGYEDIVRDLTMLGAVCKEIISD